MQNCPNCKTKYFRTNYQCKKCREIFWQSKKTFELFLKENNYKENETTTCSSCGAIQDVANYCSNCNLKTKNSIYKLEEIKQLKGIKGCFQKRPLLWILTTYSLLILLLSNLIKNEQHGMFIMGVTFLYLIIFTGYVARLRGRSIFYGLLVGIGAIIIAILPMAKYRYIKK